MKVFIVKNGSQEWHCRSKSSADKFLRSLSPAQFGQTSVVFHWISGQDTVDYRTFSAEKFLTIPAKQFVGHTLGWGMARGRR